MLELIFLIALGAGAFHDYTRGWTISRKILKQVKQARYRLESDEHHVTRVLGDAGDNVQEIKQQIASLKAHGQRCEESIQTQKAMESKLQSALDECLDEEAQLISQLVNTSESEVNNIKEKLEFVRSKIALVAKSIAQSRQMQEKLTNQTQTYYNGERSLRPKLQLATLQYEILQSDVEIIKSNHTIAKANESCYQLTGNNGNGENQTVKATVAGLLETSTHRRLKSEILLEMAAQDNGEGLVEKILQDGEAKKVIDTARARRALPAYQPDQEPRRLTDGKPRRQGRRSRNNNKDVQPEQPNEHHDVEVVEAEQVV